MMEGRKKRKRKRKKESKAGVTLDKFKWSVTTSKTYLGLEENYVYVPFLPQRHTYRHTNSQSNMNFCNSLNVLIYMIN
jgi:hypothetical protein